MKITFHRTHKVQPIQYETLVFGASVEVDTEVDEPFKFLEDPSDFSAEAEIILDELLANPVDRALRLGGQIEESHLWDFYEKD